MVPEIWPSYKTPNVLGTNPDPITATNPADMQPASISAATAAPLWYTYAYPDSTVTQRQAGVHVGHATTLAAASKRDFSSEPYRRDHEVKFYGPTVTWVYEKGPNAGIAKVTIDGADAARQARSVDQYSATAHVPGRAPCGAVSANG